MFNKPCLGCGVLVRGASYCGPCQPPKRRSPQYAAKKRELYGGSYKRRARELKQYATHCHLCGKQFVEGDTIEADHLYPELGNDSPLAPTHRHCNQQRGNTPID
jgi:hypothetical protein